MHLFILTFVFKISVSTDFDNSLNNCESCFLGKNKQLFEALFMGVFVLPIMSANLIMYARINRTLRNRPTGQNTSRDQTLTKAFMFMSLSWMVLWAPVIFIRVLFGFFLDAPAKPSKYFKLYEEEKYNTYHKIS